MSTSDEDTDSQPPAQPPTDDQPPDEQTPGPCKLNNYDLKRTINRFDSTLYSDLRYISIN